MSNQVPVSLVSGLSLVLMLSGCSATVPAISDIRSDVVKIQTARRAFETPALKSTVDAEAQRGCGEYGNVISHRLSERCINPPDCSVKEYLYACKSPSTP